MKNTANTPLELSPEQMLSTVQLRQYLSGAPQLPVDKILAIIPHFTDFQKQVWQTLLAIPCGHVTSYQTIAETLGKPDASRAVGRAIGSNPLAIEIPCHRVIRKDGQLGGYRWGLEKKLALLKKELSIAC